MKVSGCKMNVEKFEAYMFAAVLKICKYWFHGNESSSSGLLSNVYATATLLLSLVMISLQCQNMHTFKHD